MQQHISQTVECRDFFIYKAHTEPEQDYTISNSNIFVNFLCSVRHYNGVGGKSTLILFAQGGSVRE